MSKRDQQAEYEMLSNCRAGAFVSPVQASGWTLLTHLATFGYVRISAGEVPFERCYVLTSRGIIRLRELELILGLRSNHYAEDELEFQLERVRGAGGVLEVSVFDPSYPIFQHLSVLGRLLDRQGYTGEPMTGIFTLKEEPHGPILR